MDKSVKSKKFDPEHTGSVHSIRSSVVDIYFPDWLPVIYNQITIPDTDIVLEVQGHLNEHMVRCIALTSTRGLSRGDKALDKGHPITVPTGNEIKGRMFNVFEETIDDKEPLCIKQNRYRSIHQNPVPLTAQSTRSEILNTGIKAIDLLAPLERGGKAGLFGGAGVGKTILITEMINNMVSRRQLPPTKTGGLPLTPRSQCLRDD